MPIEKIRQSILSWLGVAEIRTLISTCEQEDRQRHSELMAVLARIENRLTVEHINPNDRPFNSPVLDWDTVQAIALHDLENTKEKSDA